MFLPHILLSDLTFFPFLILLSGRHVTALPTSRNFPFCVILSGWYAMILSILDFLTRIPPYMLSRVKFQNTLRNKTSNFKHVTWRKKRLLIYINNHRPWSPEQNFYEKFVALIRALG